MNTSKDTSLFPLRENACAGCLEPISGHVFEPAPVRCEGCNSHLHGGCAVTVDELEFCAACAIRAEADMQPGAVMAPTTPSVTDGWLAACSCEQENMRACPIHQVAA